MPNPNQEQNQAQNQTKNPHRVAPKWYESNTSKAIQLLKDHDLWPPSTLDNQNKIPLTLDLLKDLSGKNGVVDLLAKSKCTTEGKSYFLPFANTSMTAYQIFKVRTAAATKGFSETFPRAIPILNNISRNHLLSTCPVQLEPKQIDELQNSLDTLNDIYAKISLTNYRSGAYRDLISKLPDTIETIAELSSSLEQFYESASANIDISRNSHKQKIESESHVTIGGSVGNNTFSLKFINKDDKKNAKEALEASKKRFKYLQDQIKLLKKALGQNKLKEYLQNVDMQSYLLRELVAIYNKTGKDFYDKKHTYIFSFSINKVKKHVAHVFSKLTVPIYSQN